MKLTPYISALALFMLFAPVLAFGQTLDDVIYGIGNVLRNLIPVVMLLVLLFFFWGAAMYIFQAGDAKKVEEARTMLVWSVIIIFVLLSIWGIIGILQGIFKPDNQPVDVPQVKVEPPEEDFEFPEAEWGAGGG